MMSQVIVNSNLNGATFAMFPAYIHYIAVELLKNGMRATMEKHGSDPPPVEVNIGSDGEGRLGIEVRDLGGGIPRKHSDKVTLMRLDGDGDGDGDDDDGGCGEDRGGGGGGGHNESEDC